MAAAIHRNGSSDGSGIEKGAYAPEVVNSYDNGRVYQEDVVGAGEHLHRGLSSRQVTMIAIGGAIGTGLIIGTGKALYISGPGSLLIGYTAVGLLCFIVMAALGEMAAWLPLPSGFTGYADRFVDPALGFALGWNYWFKYIIVTPNNLTAFALVLQYWVSRDQVNPGVFITVALVVIICINYFGVKFFGEIEFWLSSLKVITILALIILSIVLAAGGGPNHVATGFTFWHTPGAFREYILTGDTGRFLGFWSVLTTAVFAFLGTELVGVTVGECQNPRRVIPRAIKLTFYRILLFYVVLVFLLGMLVPYDDKGLKLSVTGSSSSTAAASPFVVAIVNSGINGLPAVLNGCILVFVLSAANSDLYIASRTLYGLAVVGNAPRIFAKTDKRGIPIYALGLSSAFCLLAYMNVASASQKVFGYFVNLVTIFGILTWISILISHIYFVRARKAQGIPDSALAYVAPLGSKGSMGALFFCCLIAFFKGFNYFVPSANGGVVDWRSILTSYLGIPMYIIMIFGYKIIMKTKAAQPHEADLFSGKQRIDDEEAEFIAAEKARNEGRTMGRWEKIYENSIGLLF